MKATDVLLKDLTDEQLRSLPPEWIAVYLGRPRDETDAVTQASRLRFGVIGALVLYAIATHSISSISTLLLFGMVMYELAYSSMRKEKALFDWAAAQERYLAEVRALPDAGA
jgi:hypothetical protein